MNIAHRKFSVRRGYLLLLNILCAISLICLLFGLYYGGNFIVDMTAIKRRNVLPPVTSAPAPLVTPLSLSIPAINLNAPVVAVGLAADGSLQVPGYNQAGWYQNSPIPGQDGPSIIDGHLDTTFAAAVFWNLKKLKPGDVIYITLSGNSKAIFVVDSLQKYSQFNFPTQLVYGPLKYPGLRIITCAGSYSPKLGRYSDNLVVYASLEGNKGAAN